MGKKPDKIECTEIIDLPKGTATIMFEDKIIAVHPMHMPIFFGVDHAYPGEDKTLQVRKLWP